MFRFMLSFGLSLAVFMVAGMVAAVLLLWLG